MKQLPRVKITKAAEQNSVRVSNTSQSADLPIDGKFHPIHPDLLPVLDDSAVEYELENAGAASGNAKAGGAAKAGGSGRASTRKTAKKSAAPKAKKSKAK